MSAVLGGQDRLDERGIASDEDHCAGRPGHGRGQGTKVRALAVAAGDEDHPGAGARLH